tara:strand:+ start:2039 stop:2953 length:915 start_codon:yes stop_codon:yes gene_type:complete
MVSSHQLKKRTWSLLEPAEENDKQSKILDIFLVCLISLNVFFVILETVDILYQKYETFFITFEIFSIIIFSFEYVARIWACTEEKKTGSFLKKRVKYIFSFPAIIDALAILPSIIAIFFPSVDLRFIRVLRILRLLKFSRYSNSINSLLSVLWDQRRSFGAAFFILFIVLIISSSGMYLVEKNVQPDKFGSIPQAMWWAIVTLTTVGYGDTFPITSAGKFFGSLIIILGIGTVALPSGILASAFTEFSRRNQQRYENKLKVMLEDDFIDKKEREELDKLSQKLNLSEDEILSIEEYYSKKKGGG